MNTPIAIALFAALTLSGCASPTQNTPHSMTAEDSRIWERQFSAIRPWFNQPATDFRRTEEVRIVNGVLYRLWIVTKLHGSKRIFRAWISEEGKLFDVPYCNDGRIPDEPPVDSRMGGVK